jgi:UDP-glucose 4-epimerase
MSKVLITGGAGFIGSHLAEKYLSLGHNVNVIDDLSTGSFDNITHLQKIANNLEEEFAFTKSTILNTEVMTELIQKCDFVIHLASSVGVKNILNNPLYSIENNVFGTKEVLRLCSRFNKKVLIASSSEVYGIQDKAPLSEVDDVILGSSNKSRWSYATAKLLGEFEALAYWRVCKTPVVIARFFNVAGSRQTSKYGMVLPNFVSQAVKGDAVTVFGDGSQTRTFAHIDDVCDCVVKLMQSDSALGEVINIGGAREISIFNLAEMVIERSNSYSEIILIPYEEVFDYNFEDMPRRVPCTEKLNSIIGFVPERGLEMIVDDVINFVRFGDN